MRGVVPIEHVLVRGRTDEARVGAQVLARARSHRRALEDHTHRASGSSSRDVISIGRGHDDRQRDATRVDQQHPLAPIFSPGQWGWARPTPGPAVPSITPRRCSAIARRCPPSRHTQPAPLATALRKTHRPSPIPETACGWRSRCRNAHAGSAFHWQPVRSTYTIASNTSRAVLRFAPAARLAREASCAPVAPRAAGTSGSTRSQNASETSHESKPRLRHRPPSVPRTRRERTESVHLYLRISSKHRSLHSGWIKGLATPGAPFRGGGRKGTRVPGLPWRGRRGHGAKPRRMPFALPLRRGTPLMCAAIERWRQRIAA